MGLDLSRTTNALTPGKRWIRCPDWRDVLFRSTNELSTADKYAAEEDKRVVHPWQVVHEEPIEKWRKAQISVNYEPFPHCSSQNKSVKDDEKPYRVPCYVGRQEGSSVIYQVHSRPRQTFTYTTIDLLTEAQFQYIIPTSSQHTAFFFRSITLDGQERGIVAFDDPETEHPFYFFLGKAAISDPIMATISPDVSTVCLLSSDPESASGDQYNIQVYRRRPAAYDRSFSGVAFELEYEIPGLQPDKGCPRIMFDPRFHSSRLGVINVNVVQDIRITHYFMVYDLKAKRAVTMPNEMYVSNDVDLDLLDAGYSPDGAWVHALIGHVLPEMGDKYMRSVWIIGSDSLQIVKTVDIGSGNVDVCAVNFLPTYSKCCRTMALRHRKLVKIYQLPIPDSLQALCRSVILKTVADLNTLDISSQIKSYLQFKAYL